MILNQCCISFYSYIKPQLYALLSYLAASCISFYSYIKPQPLSASRTPTPGCISFYSYIKPQPDSLLQKRRDVVYRSIPTSNRNALGKRPIWTELYIVLFLHQTATVLSVQDVKSLLYIVLFLHQTATMQPNKRMCESCISFYSYIKPQPLILIQML